MENNKEFINFYSNLTGISAEQVEELLKIQCEQNTKFSRVKACEALWDHQQTKLDEKDKLLREAAKLLSEYFDPASTFRRHLLCEDFLNKPEIKALRGEK